MAGFKTTPYTLGVYDLVNHPGEMREAHVQIDAHEKLGEGLLSVGCDEPIGIDVRLESVHEGIFVSGEVDTLAAGVCGRCLTEITQPVKVDFHELFAYSLDEACDYEVHDDHVDLEPLVRDSVVLSLPFQPVCQPDCLGLDPKTGNRVVDMQDSEPEESIDPRWSVLASFHASDTEDNQPTSNAPTGPGEKS